MKHTFKSDSYNCKFCNQDGRTKTTTQCPEATLCDDIAKRVQAGQLDFRNNTWTNVVSEQESMKQMDDAVSSLFEFMEAMVPELSPEASDELTDEDIDLLKNINSVPLPVSCVSKLELPVDQLVSLHKLKRLDYVYVSMSSISYFISDKGKEFLKPKPVTLTISQLHTLTSINNKSMLIGDVSGYGIWTEVEYLKSIDLIHQKSGKAVISTKGYEHLQKLLAVLV